MSIVKREREKIMKVKIIKNTWGHSKKCWYIIDVATNIAMNYTGYTSKKAAMKVVEDAGGEVVEFGEKGLSCNWKGEVV